MGFHCSGDAVPGTLKCEDKARLLWRKFLSESWGQPAAAAELSRAPAAALGSDVLLQVWLSQPQTLMKVLRFAACKYSPHSQALARGGGGPPKPTRGVRRV